VSAAHRIGHGVGQPGFVDARGLADDARRQAVADVTARIRQAGLRTVRTVIVDQHGAPRSKHLDAEAAISALDNGLDFSGAIYSLDTSNAVFPPPFAAGGGFGIPEFSGFPDVVLVPDPTTFKIVPWADRTGWIICNAYFTNGRPVPFDGRTILGDQLARLDAAGYRYLVGLEVELYITRLASGAHPTPGAAFEVITDHDTGQPGPAPLVAPLARGYQYLSEARLDGISDVLIALRDALYDLGMPARSMEDEWGPGQLEVTFSPVEGLAAADDMILFRTAVKAICARRGLLASFMCWPSLPNFFPSGWHLHQSLLDRETGANAFAHPEALLSPVGRHFAAGLLRSARPMTLLGAPTVNGIRRFRPYSFAPDRIAWGADNRGALIRVQGGPGDESTHLENRIGEPAANPYLYLAANLAAGRSGIEDKLDPPPLLETDPYATDAEPLPSDLGQAIDAFDADPLYRREFGSPFVDYLVMMKRFELGRYEAARAAESQSTTSDAKVSDSTVSDWEMREYFEFF
jgi:glutamine synthetase